MWDRTGHSVGRDDLIYCLMPEYPSTTGQDKNHTESSSLSQPRTDKDSTTLVVLQWYFMAPDRKWGGLHFTHNDKLHELAEMLAMK